MNFDSSTILAILAVIGGIIFVIGLIKKLFKLVIAGVIIGFVAYVVFYILRIFVG